MCSGLASMIAARRSLNSSTVSTRRYSFIAQGSSGIYQGNPKMLIRSTPRRSLRGRTFVKVPVKRAGRLRQRHGLIVKGKRISCPPPQNLLIRVALPVQEYDYEHGFPLIRSLRASTQRSTSVLFSFVLSLLIVAASFSRPAIKTILARSCGAGRCDFSRTIRAIGNAVTMKGLNEGKRFASHSGAASTPPVCSAA
jgi:hypothetical protein